MLRLDLNASLTQDLAINYFLPILFQSVCTLSFPRVNFYLY